MLVQAIPAYRLPREIVAREVRMIEHLGVEIFTNMVLGEDVTLKGLRAEGYDAVFLGVGARPAWAWDARRGGRRHYRRLELLAHLQSPRFGPRGQERGRHRRRQLGHRRRPHRLALGAEKVTVVYRRSREAMPAYEEEIEEAEHEGVQLRLLTAPVEVVLEGKRVSGIKCLPMRLGEFDRSGRRRPEEGGNAFILQADQVLVAMGQTLDLQKITNHVSTRSPQPDVYPSQPGDRPDLGKVDFRRRRRRHRPVVGRRGGGGGRAGRRRHRPLPDRHEPRLLARGPARSTPSFDPDAEPSDAPREKLNLLPVERRRNNFDEVEQPWREPVAVRQAGRCLRCDYGKRCAANHPEATTTH